MILYLDTQDPKLATVKLLSSDKVVAKTWQSQFDLSETFLPTIEKLVKSQKTEISDLTAIAVVVGPGLFSRLRTAVVSANTLAFALGIKIIPLKGSEISYKLLKKRPRYTQVVPKYDKAPNITKPK